MSECEGGGPVTIDPVVDQHWWRDHLDEVILADVRWYSDGRSGEQAYDDGHLPGAIFVDLDARLSAKASAADGRHPLPDAAMFAQGMARLGIGDEHTVIAYDDAGGVIAARLVWMLRVTGHEAALLDGGLLAYRGPLVTERPEPPATAFTPRPWPSDRLADIDDAADRANLVIDARDGRRYRGEPDTLDPRSGHIPGARSLPCRENLDADGTFLEIDELRRRFEGMGVVAGGEVISYCGSGVTACHNLLALEHAKIGTGRLFAGSWSQYSNAPDRPVVTGISPG